jgi:DNA polymerase-4
VSLAGLTDDPPPALFEAVRFDADAARSDPARSDPARPDPGPRDSSHTGAGPAVLTAEDPGPLPLPDPSPADATSRAWRPGDDVHHPEHGHGWVQGAGHGRVTVRFETRSTGPGRARTFAAADPDLVRTDPLGSLD